MNAYETFISRNSGYISESLQSKIRSTHLLIAGCGIGSTLAESAARIGFEKFTLVDKDIVDLSNLNRQCFTYADIGTPKTSALAKRLKSINPSVQITEIMDWIDIKNSKKIVNTVDFVFDTIDFLSLDGIVALHDECFKQKKPVVSALGAGWGAGVICFLQKDAWTFRKVFKIPEGEISSDASYVKHFMEAFSHIAEHLNPQVVQAMGRIFHLMEDGRPCPASQISPGAAAVASLGITIALKIISGESVPTAPHMILVDPYSQFKQFSLL